MITLFRPLLLISSLWLITACASKNSLPERTSLLAPEQRQQQLIAMQRFTVQASLGIKSPSESLSGSLRWQQQQADTYQARLANPIGISLFELTSNENQTELLVRGERYQAADASSLLWQLAGWSIPLQDMALWLRGLPGESAADMQFDQAGRLVSFRLVDSTGIHWKLTYRSFFNDELSLPRQLQLQSADTQLQLVIRSWQQ